MTADEHRARLSVELHQLCVGYLLDKHAAHLAAVDLHNAKVAASTAPVPTPPPSPTRQGDVTQQN